MTPKPDRIYEHKLPKGVKPGRIRIPRKKRVRPKKAKPPQLDASALATLMTAQTRLRAIVGFEPTLTQTVKYLAARFVKESP